jgi:ATP-binding protein involved in chromosome partitioning
VQLVSAAFLVGENQALSVEAQIATLLVRRLLADLSRLRADVVGGVENMSGFVCPHCANVTELFPPAPEDEHVWDLIPRLAVVPFSPLAAADRFDRT